MNLNLFYVKLFKVESYKCKCERRPPEQRLFSSKSENEKYDVRKVHQREGNPSQKQKIVNKDSEICHLHLRKAGQHC